MAPGGSGGAKRKRHGDFNGNNSERPSPHRPENMPLAQQSNRSPTNGVRDGRRPSANFNASNGIMNAKSPTPASTPIPAMSTSSAPPTASKSASHPVPFHHYAIITEERMKDWQGSGRAAVVAEGTQACNNNNFLDLGILFQDIIRAGLDGKLPATEAGKIVEEILAADTTATADAASDAPAFFLDTLSVESAAFEQDISNPNLTPLVIATNISPILMREVLEEPMLLALKLVRPTFGRTFIRKQTSILYKQSNFNLVREESEGYSKLITELFTVSENEPPSAEVVKDTFENMKAMIGAFDMDPARVLDITLDIFASLLVKHYRFFIKLLRASSWWPHTQSFDELPAEDQRFTSLPSWALPDHSHWTSSDQERDVFAALKEDRDIEFWDRARQVGINAFFELGGRRVVEGPELELYLKELEDSSDNRAAETAKWIKETKSLPPRGNVEAAQLLGNKLRFYTSDARDAYDTLPFNLIYLAALLIKTGFISLRDLYPHIYPSDADMDAVKEKQTKEKQERDATKRPGGGQLNALARAGALPDDTLTTTLAPSGRMLRDSERPSTPARSEAKPVASAAKVEDEEKEQLPEPSDQKVQLLKSLLCIGAIPEALYLLGRFPWLVDLYPDIPEFIHRILHYSIHKVYEPLCPLAQRDTIRIPSKTPSSDQAGVPKGELRLTTTQPPKSLRWAKLDQNDSGDGIDYRFYWDDWNDNVPVCQNVDDVFTLCNTFLNLSGVKIGQDTTLLTKLARIGKQSILDDGSPANHSRWVDLCKRLLCPALSLTKVNPGVVNEVFELLKMFETKTRYTIYSEWFLGPTSRIQDIQEAFDLSKAETKDVLKRISKTNTREMARTLAKVTCASPGVVFAVVLNQIESYDNLIDVVVECGRYFTFMGYDVLAWSLMITLGRQGRSRIDKDGISTSNWLKVLSSFTGRVFKRYPVMNALPILQYVIYQLSKGNFTDLRVLRELVTSMAGVIPDVNYSDSQIQAMAGGELLQAQTLKLMQDKRFDSKASAKRFVRTLVEHGLVGAFLVGIAQERQKCLIANEASPLKVTGENFDEIQIIFNQFLDMARSTISPETFGRIVPSIVQLIQEFGLDANIAFMIHRKTLSTEIEEYKSTEKVVPAPLDGDIEMEDVTDKEKELDSADINIDENNVETGLSLEKESKATALEEISPWHPALQNLIDQFRVIVEQDFESRMSVPFFVTFWQLSLNDMVAPYNSYDEEIKRHNDRIHQISIDKDSSSAAQRRKEAEKKSLNELLDKLREEMKTQLTSHQLTRKRLMKEKSHWFRGFHGNWAALNTALLQECFIPRLLLSPLDSHFAFKMLFFLHSSGTNEFRTMHFIDTFFNEKTLTHLMFQCTGREAENLGRFLNELLKELASWHADKASYEKKAYGPNKDLPGFAQSHPKGKQPTKYLDYEDFRTLLFKWHRFLNESLKNCLNSWEYMHIKNAIVVMRSISQYFPAVDFMGAALYKSVELVSRKMKDTHRDLWVLANSLLANLSGRKKKWIMPQAFYHGATGFKNQQQKGTNTPVSEITATEAGKTSAPAASKQLPKKIPDLASKATIGAELKAGTTGMEDGEVEDGGAEASAKNKRQDLLASERNKAAQENPPTTSTVIPKPTAGDKENSDISQMGSNQVNGKTSPEMAPKSSGATVPGRAPHALPSRPDVGPMRATRYPERRSTTASERPESRQNGRSHQEPPRSNVRNSGTAVDLMQQKLDDRRAPSPGRLDPTGTANQPEKGSRPSSRGATDSSDRNDSSQEQINTSTPTRSAPRMNPPRYREPEGPPARGGSSLRTRTDANQTSNAAHDGARERAQPDPPINPDRAAFIMQQTSNEEPSRSNHRSSRPHSPTRRGGGDHNAHPSTRDGRPELMARSQSSAYESRSGGSSRQEYADETPRGGAYPPALPRDRERERDRDRDRAHMRVPQAQGDYPAVRPPRHDPNYGRLNADPGPPPSPRHHNERPRMPTPEREGRHYQHRAPSPSSYPSGSGPGSRQQASAPRSERNERSERFERSEKVIGSEIQDQPAVDTSGMHPDRLKALAVQSHNSSNGIRQPQQQDTTSPVSGQAPPLGPRTTGGRQQTSNTSRGTPTGPSNTRQQERSRQNPSANPKLEEPSPQQPAHTARGPQQMGGDSLDRRIRGRALEASLDNSATASTSMEHPMAQTNGASGPRRRMLPPQHADSQREREREREDDRRKTGVRGTNMGGRDLMDSPGPRASERNGHRSSASTSRNDVKEPGKEGSAPANVEYSIRGQTSRHDLKERDRERERSPSRRSTIYREREHHERARERRDHNNGNSNSNNSMPPPPMALSQAGKPPAASGRAPSLSRRSSDNSLNSGATAGPAVPNQWQAHGGEPRRREVSSSGGGGGGGGGGVNGRKRGWTGDDGSPNGPPQQLHPHAQRDSQHQQQQQQLHHHGNSERGQKRPRRSIN